MTLDNYEPLSFKQVEALPSKYEMLKELTSRGLYWRDSKQVEHSQKEILQYFGDDVFKRLFCSEFSEEVYGAFAFSKEIDDQTRLLRNCGRGVAIHSLRALKHAKDAGASLRAQKIAALHDSIENFWKHYIVLSNMRAFDGKNLQYVQSLKFNFLKFDPMAANLNYLREVCEDFPAILNEKFDSEISRGVVDISNMKSIKQKLKILKDGNGIEDKSMGYLDELIQKALEGDDSLDEDVLIARGCDRIDNMITMMYLLPKEQLRFTDKTIIHLNGAIKVKEKRNISADSAYFRVLKKLARVSKTEVKRCRDYHEEEPEDGYKLEYRTADYADEFDDRLSQIKRIKNEVDAMISREEGYLNVRL